LSILVIFILSRWNLTDEAEQAFIIKPVYPIEYSQFDLLNTSSGFVFVDDFRFIETVNDFD